MSDARRPVERKLLESLVPLGSLQPEAFQELAGKTWVEQLPAGRTLFTLGQRDRQTFYLLAGEVELIAQSGAREGVIGGSPQARVPLSPQQPRIATATTRTDIQFIRIDSDLLELLLGAPAPAGYEVHEEVEREAADSRIFHEIVDEYLADRLVLPIMPDLAVRVRGAFQDARLGVAELARIIQMDAALTARLIQVANSPRYRGHAHIDNCRAAITRLGLATTRNLVTSFTLHRIFRTNSSVLRGRMLELWAHSSHVAAVSCVLAQLTPGFDTDRALLAGLIHDIGVLPILTHVEHYPEVLAERALLDAIVDKLRGQIGAMVLRKWQFDDDLVTAALEAEDWYRNPGQPADYCDIVLVAQLHSQVGARVSGRPRLYEVPAFTKLALGQLTPDLSLRILDEAREEISSVQQLLEH